MSDFSFISERRVLGLSALATYKFCTAEHLFRLGVGANPEYARKALNWVEAATPGTIKNVSPGFKPGHGRLPNLYFLTKSGAELTAELLGIDTTEVKYPKGRVLAAFNDYAHRVNTIDCFISYRMWADKNGYSIEFADAYFDTDGANRGGTGNKMLARTRVEYASGYVLADGISIFSTPKKRYLFLLEMYNGSDTKRVLEQLEKHALAMADGTPSAKFNFDRGSFVACVFETRAAMQAAMSRIRATTVFKAFREHVLFAALEDVKGKGWGDCWTLFDGVKERFDG